MPNERRWLFIEESIIPKAAIGNWLINAKKCANAHIYALTRQSKKRQSVFPIRKNKTQ